MACPKKKTSKSRRNMRRAHDFLIPAFSVKCEFCGALKLRHRICPSCGTYRHGKLNFNKVQNDTNVATV